MFSVLASPLASSISFPGIFFPSLLPLLVFSQLPLSSEQLVIITVLRNLLYFNHVSIFRTVSSSLLLTPLWLSSCSPHLIASQTPHPSLHFALPAPSFSFFLSLLQIIFLFHNWQTCTGNILEKSNFELFTGNPRTSVCFHPTGQAPFPLGSWGQFGF